MKPEDQDGAAALSRSEPIGGATAERPADYPFSRWGRALQKAVLKLSGRPRHCSVNALRGLKRAWAIAPLDPEMAYFRAITAEEEAATALMSALKVRRYPGAENLSFRNHLHKAGLYPFLRVVESVFAESGFPAPQYRLRYEGDDPLRLDVQLPSEALGLGPGFQASPDEPLNLVVRKGGHGEGPGIIDTFDDRLAKFAGGQGHGSLIEAIRDTANLRNRVLYASDAGIASVRNVDPGLVERQRPVNLMITLAIAVLQTRKHQLLGVQGLEAYLRALGRLPEAPFDYVAALGEPAETMIEVTRSATGETRARLNRVRR